MQNKQVCVEKKKSEKNRFNVMNVVEPRNAMRVSSNAAAMAVENQSRTVRSHHCRRRRHRDSTRTVHVTPPHWGPQPSGESTPYASIRFLLERVASLANEGAAQADDDADDDDADDDNDRPLQDAPPTSTDTTAVTRDQSVESEETKEIVLPFASLKEVCFLFF